MKTMNHLNTFRIAVFVLLALLSAAASSAQQAPFLEDFDAPGSDMASSVFDQLIVSGGGTFHRDTLNASSGAPDENPELPINVGSDRELAYYEQSLAATGSYAFTSAQFNDVTIDGYVGIGYNSSFGSRSAAFVARMTGTTIRSVDAYTALIAHHPSGSTLRLARIDNGIVRTLTGSGVFSFDSSSENLRLNFTVTGSSLSATLWRVELVGGVVTETPIDLNTSVTGIQNTITASDSLLTSGAVGVRAFARSSNQVFFEEMFVDDPNAVPPPTPVVLEDFDQAGSDMGSSELSRIIASGDGTYVREALAVADGAPATTPELPINAGSDKELRYYEQSLASTGSYALTPDQPDRIFTDVAIDGYVGIGYNNTFGSRSAAFVARMTGTSIPTVNAYAAIVTHQLSGSLSFSLQRITNGVGSILASATVFTPVDLSSEHLRLQFSLEGTTLTAALWRLSESGGEVVEVPVDLDSVTPGEQNTLTVTDTGLTSGGVGVRSFARSTNQVFYDEIAIFDLTE